MNQNDLIVLSYYCIVKRLSKNSDGTAQIELEHENIFYTVESFEWVFISYRKNTINLKQL